MSSSRSERLYSGLVARVRADRVRWCVRSLRRMRLKNLTKHTSWGQLCFWALLACYLMSPNTRHHY